jgi:hypothetical protein
MSTANEKVTFEDWQRETLVQFANEANERLKTQQAEINALRSDLKMLLKVWRDQMS